MFAQSWSRLEESASDLSVANLDSKYTNYMYIEELDLGARSFAVEGVGLEVSESGSGSVKVVVPSTLRRSVEAFV